MYPTSLLIQSAQAVEMQNQISLADYTFELINNKLRIFPKPDHEGIRLHFQYSKRNSRSNVMVNSPYSGSSNLVTNPSNVPYGTITYSQINHPGKQWIYEYTLALASELLGLIRGKYTTVPIPGAETTLNATDLVSKGRDMQKDLREKLRLDFEDMSRKAQLERKQSENQSLNDTLGNVPLLIFLG
jgi:hypothetical protein